jgi:caffeoyl-CoA O-methyltransferase
MIVMGDCQKLKPNTNNQMDIIQKELQEYAERHTSAESPLLKKINRETYAHVLDPRMLSGQLQGRVLSMISCMIRPRVILEIGTFTGYSALCLAEGLQKNGVLITIDINEELHERVSGYFREADVAGKIDYRIGDAGSIIPQVKEKLDLVFIDADKENYGRYFDLVIDRVNLNGIILADNVLWSGKVLEAKPDKATRAIVDFNAKVLSDSRVENVLLPIRDGIMLMRKISQ